MIELPRTCVVDKFIPKKTFYEKVNISNSIREEFTDKLSRIYWKYKISEGSINIAKTDNVEEIEIFEIELKEKYNCKNIIQIITKNIPYPILFYIRNENEFQYAIKYNDKIFFSKWNNDIGFNFSAINLKILYENVVKKIADISEKVDDLDYEIKKQDKINRLNMEMERLQAKMRNEKQFNIKVQYNEQISKIKKEIEELNNNE